MSGSVESGPLPDEDGDDGGQCRRRLAVLLQQAALRLGTAVQADASAAGAGIATTPDLGEGDSVNELYKASLDSFRCVGHMPDEAKRGHYYRRQCAGAAGKVGPRVVRAVSRELRKLRTSLPLEAGSSIFVRYDKARPYLMQALITGPAGTPYEGGCFLFDIYCPPEYPEVPPLVRLATTGNGTVRFNPNLVSLAVNRHATAMQC